MQKLKVVFKQQNPEFNKGYAREYFQGKESPGNHKDIWSRGYSLTIKEFNYFSKTDYVFSFLQEEKEKKKLLKNMTVLKCITENDQLLEIVISKDLIKNVYKSEDKKYNIIKCYFYFKPRNDFQKIDDFMYLLNEDISTLKQ